MRKASSLLESLKKSEPAVMTPYASLLSEYGVESISQLDESSLDEFHRDVTESKESGVSASKTANGHWVVSAMVGTGSSERRVQKTYVDYSRKEAIAAFKDEFMKDAVKESEDKVTDEKSFREYAEKVLKKAHGDDYDEQKGKETIDGILKKADGDMEKAVGMLSGSVSESAILEGAASSGMVVMTIMDRDVDRDVVFLANVSVVSNKVTVRLIPRTAADLDFISDGMVDRFVKSTINKAVRVKSSAAGYTYEVPIDVVQDLLLTTLNG